MKNEIIFKKKDNFCSSSRINTSLPQEMSDKTVVSGVTSTSPAGATETLYKLEECIEKTRRLLKEAEEEVSFAVEKRNAYLRLIDALPRDAPGFTLENDDQWLFFEDRDSIGRVVPGMCFDSGDGWTDVGGIESLAVASGLFSKEEIAAIRDGCARTTIEIFQGEPYPLAQFLGDDGVREFSQEIP